MNNAQNLHIFFLRISHFKVFFKVYKFYFYFPALSMGSDEGRKDVLGKTLNSVYHSHV